MARHESNGTGTYAPCVEAAMTNGEQSPNTDDESSNSSPDDVREAVVKNAWNEMYPNNDNLLFGSRETAVDVFTLHPEQVQIFRLWQIYLDNVNPLLKVTHTSTLQARIIDAASNLADIKPALAALMFSIYCVSIMSLGEDECRTMFGLRRECLLTRYQFGCQQALLNCGFLRSADRECLTALYLYLVSLSGYHLHAGLTFSDLGETRYRSSVSVIHTRRCDPDCATHGASQ